MINVAVKKNKLIKNFFLFNLISSGALALAAIIFLCVWKFNLNKPLDSIGIVKDLFSDFSQVVLFALSDNPYDPSVGTSYLPLAVLIVYPFALICKSQAHLNYFDLVHTPQFFISYFLFLTVFFTCAVLLLKKLLNVRGRYFVLFCLACLFSGMIVFMVVRGNNLLSVFVFVLFFLAYHKSEKKILRELALICLAAAGVIKIYPLFFGVILLKDKKIWGSVRVGIYTVALVFLPFLFFDGGFSNVRLFLTNVSDFSFGGGRLFHSRNMSAPGLIYKFFNFIAPSSSTAAVLSKVLAVTVSVVFFALAVIGSFLSRDKLSLYMICVAAMVLIPSVTYYYLLVFLVPPLIEFVNNYESFSLWRRRFYLMFFLIVPCVILCPLRHFVFQSLCLVIVLFYESISNLRICINERKRKKRQRS